MDSFFSITGTFFLILLFVLLFALALLLTVCISHPKIIIKYKDSLEIIANLWFFRFNITKFLSKNKKNKTPKAVHFDGTLFGEFPESKKTKKKNKHKKKTIQKNTDKLAAKEKKPLTETASDALELVTNILDDIKDPLKKILKADIKKLYITAASDDPHKTAVLFGNMNTAMGILITVCKKFASFSIDEDNAGVYCDFLSPKPRADAYIVLTLSLRHIIICGFKATMRFIKNK